jgi:hypothetical protein
VAQEHVGDLVQDDVVPVQRAGRRFMEDVIGFLRRDPDAAWRVGSRDPRHAVQMERATALCRDPVTEDLEIEGVRDLD